MCVKKIFFSSRQWNITRWDTHLYTYIDAYTFTWKLALKRNRERHIDEDDYDDIVKWERERDRDTEKCEWGLLLSASSTCYRHRFRSILFHFFLNSFDALLFFLRFWLSFTFLFMSACLSLLWFNVVWIDILIQSIDVYFYAYMRSFDLLLPICAYVHTHTRTHEHTFVASFLFDFSLLHVSFNSPFSMIHAHSCLYVYTFV